MFTCKGCREVARLVGEVEDIRQVLETMKRVITGQGLEEEIGETGDQVAGWEETEEKEKCERGMTPGDILSPVLVFCRAERYFCRTRGRNRGESISAIVSAISAGEKWQKSSKPS